MPSVHSKQPFGPAERDVWEQLESRAVDGDADPRGASIVARAGEWMVVLDTYTPHGVGATRTRLRAPFVNPEGFRFHVYKKRLFSDIAKKLGRQDVEIGDPAFDEAFIIKANDEERVRAVLGDPRIRELLAAQPDVHFGIEDDEGCFGPRFPRGVDELTCEMAGVVDDPDRLQQLYALFARTLRLLTHHGSAYEPDAALAA